MELYFHSGHVPSMRAQGLLYFIAGVCSYRFGCSEVTYRGLDNTRHQHAMFLLCTLLRTFLVLSRLPVLCVGSSEGWNGRNLVTTDVRLQSSLRMDSSCGYLKTPSVSGGQL